MTIDKSIFSPPFASSEKLQPSPGQLAAFTEDRRKNVGDQQDQNLASFRDLLRSAEAFQQKQLPRADQEDIRKYLFYGALHYSRFADRALLEAVQLFQYQRHALASIDLDRPASFIQAAEKTIRTLSKKKIEDVLRKIRLREMINERKKMIENRRQPWEEVAEELRRIALYIKDNLHKIQKTCEASIIMISDPGIIGQKERLLAENMKAHFKDQAKDVLHSGKGTAQDIQHLLQEANQAGEELSTAFQEDINAITGLYEALHEHVKKTVQTIEVLLAKIEGKKEGSPEEKRTLYATLEHALVSLLSVHRLEQQTEEIRTETPHEQLINQKRVELLDHLFDIIQKDRRARTDRRSGEDRRKFTDPNYKGPERRSGKDRRSGKNRRAE